MPFDVVALQRCPVKSMGGEALDRVELNHWGLVGDRWFAVENERGHFASGKRTRRFRRHDEVFAYQSMITTDGGVEVCGDGGSWRVGNTTLDDELTRALGLPVRVTPESSVPHQDAGSVSLVGTASLRWCSERLGVDAEPRRLRGNAVSESDEPFIEEQWIGRTICVGRCVLRVVARVERCRMIDIPQDNITPEHRWLKPLAEHRGMKLAVYADVVVPGQVRVGDTIRGSAPILAG